MQKQKKKERGRRKMWHATNYCSDQQNIYYQHNYYHLTYCLQKSCGETVPHRQCHHNVKTERQHHYIVEPQINDKDSISTKRHCQCNVKWQRWGHIHSDNNTAISNGKDSTSTKTMPRQCQMAKTASPQHNAMATAEAMLNRNDDGISAKTTPWG